MPNEELTRILGLLSEEQAKSQALEEKVESMEKQLRKSKDLERELEKVNSKVLELNRRFEDANRAYEQEKKVSGQLMDHIQNRFLNNAHSIEMYYVGGTCTSRAEGWTLHIHVLLLDRTPHKQQNRGKLQLLDKELL